MSDRTFRIDSPHMKGDDVRAWQRFLFDDFRSRWNIEYPLTVDGDYGVGTRSATASFLRAWGVESAAEAMDHGITPELRIKIRNNDRTQREAELAQSQERKDYRAQLRARFARIDVCYPVPNLITDDWGYQAGHDGVDLICPWKQPVLAICTGIIRRVSPSGWWGANAQPSSGHPVSDGDGIVILESTIQAGPFVPGLKFGYGHSELAVVGVGERVVAGQHIARAGWARAPHIHFMVNDNPPVDDFYRGVGDRDPAPFLRYARYIESLND
jgi:murein DD-endopeptidase MepM/ murein hydrolase activator NlpD